MVCSLQLELLFESGSFVIIINYSRLLALHSLTAYRAWVEADQTMTNHDMGGM